MSKNKTAKFQEVRETTELQIEKTVCAKEGHNFDSMQQQIGVISVCRKCGKAIVNTRADVRNREDGKV